MSEVAALPAIRAYIDPELRKKGSAAGYPSPPRLKSKKLSFSVQGMLGGTSGVGSGANGGGAGGGRRNEADPAPKYNFSKTFRPTAGSASPLNNNTSTVEKNSAGQAAAGHAEGAAAAAHRQAAGGERGRESSSFAEDDASTAGTAEVSPAREHRLGTTDVAVFMGELGVNPDDRVVAEAVGGGFVSLAFGAGVSELGLTVVPAVGGEEGDWCQPTGAKLRSLVPRRGAGSALEIMKLLRPGDVLTDINGDDVRAMPFPQIIRLLTSSHRSSSGDSLATPNSAPPRPHSRRPLPAAPRTPSRDAMRSGARPSPPGALPSPPASEPRSRSLAKFRPFAAPLSDGRRSSWRPAAASGALGVAGEPVTPGRLARARGLAARLNSWGSSGTPGSGGGGGGGGGGVRGKLAPVRRLRLNMQKRSLSMGEEASPMPKSPPSTPSRQRATEPMTITPAPLTTLRFSQRFCAEWPEGVAVAVAVAVAVPRPGEDESPVTRGVRESGLGAAGELRIEEGVEDADEDEDEEVGVSPRVGVVREMAMDVSQFFGSSSSDDDADDSPAPPPALLSRKESSAAARNGARAAAPRGGRGAREEPLRPARPQGKGKRVSVSEECEEEIVLLSRYLTCADRGWPWTGRDIIWAEYVSLNGRHRWVRSEGCRHVLLLVRGAMFLLELPSDAAERHNTNDLVTRCPGGWYLRIDAPTLRSVSVPLTKAEMNQGGDSSDWTEAASSGGAEGGPASSSGGGAFLARAGLIFHGKGGACAWVECGGAGSRDVLVDVVSAWFSAETKGGPLVVARESTERAAAKLKKCGQGRLFASLLDAKQACELW